MATPENNFIGRVNKHVRSYKEKTNNPYRGGTPDVYYEGSFHLWVEYKFILLPKRGSTLIIPELSELQKAWLRRCDKNTGCARVIVGCKEGGTVFEFPAEWETGMTTVNFKLHLFTVKELGTYIDTLCKPI